MDQNCAILGHRRPLQAAKNTPKMTKNGHNLEIFGLNDVYRMYFAEKNQLGKTWSCLVMFGRVYDHHESKNGLSAIFRPWCPPKCKSDQKWQKWIFRPKESFWPYAHHYFAPNMLKRANLNDSLRRLPQKYRYARIRPFYSHPVESRTLFSNEKRCKLPNLLYHKN